MAPENVRAASAAGSAKRLRRKRHAAAGFDRMIEASPSLPEPIQRAITATFIDAWPQLPDSLKAVMLAIVDAVR